MLRFGGARACATQRATTIEKQIRNFIQTPLSLNMGPSTFTPVPFKSWALQHSPPCLSKTGPVNFRPRCLSKAGPFNFHPRCLSKLGPSTFNPAPFKTFTPLDPYLPSAEGRACVHITLPQLEESLFALVCQAKEPETDPLLRPG